MEESVSTIKNEMGHFEKVSLPGESLWVRVIQPPHMGTMIGQVDNRPISRLHSVKFGDVVRFGWVVRELDGESYGAWEPE